MSTRRNPDRDPDGGFTLIEVLASLSVIGLVLTAATTFFVRSMVTIDLQGSRQVAIQVASTSLEQLRAMSGEPAMTWLLGKVDAGTTAVPNTQGSLAYRQTWTCVEGASPCVATTLTTALGSGPIFLGATVKITWTSKDCAASLCSYSATTKISITRYEPVFGTS
jgi:prepilin-type N-terminal cleavage/methylation domain-containing protein